MSDTTLSAGPHHGLPDPDLDRQFYDGVTSKRLVAWVIDVLVVAVFSILATLFVAIFTLGIGFFLLPPIWLTASFVYRTLTIANRSATWGMRLMGIELRDRSGDRFDTMHAAIHTGIFMVSMASLIGWLVSVLMMVGSRLGQGLPDMILGSTAINRPVD